MKVVCPNCARQLNVARATLGKTGKCPACRAVIRVPSRAEPATVKQDVPTPIEAATSTAEPTGAMLSAADLAVLIMGASLALLVFVGWMFHSQAARTQAKIAASLTPSEKRDMEEQLAEMRGQITTARGEIGGLETRRSQLNAEMKGSKAGLEALRDQESNLAKGREASLKELQEYGVKDGHLRP